MKNILKNFSINYPDITIEDKCINYESAKDDSRTIHLLKDVNEFTIKTKANIFNVTIDEENNKFEIYLHEDDGLTRFLFQNNYLFVSCIFNFFAENQEDIINFEDLKKDIKKLVNDTYKEMLSLFIKSDGYQNPNIDRFYSRYTRCFWL